MLADVAKIFDPLGLISPITITLKICLQEVWRQSIYWDDNVDAHTQEVFFGWINQLPLLRDYAIPRCVTLPNMRSAELHVFCDASQVAYAAVVYIRVTSHDGEVKTTMLTSKTKVAPLKTQSVPRLELCAALLGTRLVNSVKESLTGLGVDLKVYAWTDSEIVLQWLNSHPGRWQTYVANIICEIQENIPRPQWLHVPTEQNPADCASRGLTVQEFVTHRLFREGPSFIGHEFSIPTQPNERSGAPEEEKPDPLLVAAVAVDKEPPPGILNIINLTKYSSLNKAVGTLTQLRRATAILKAKVRKGALVFLQPQAEKAESLRLITRAVQEDEFREEIATLNLGEQVHKKNKLFRMYPFVDKDGILQVGGRLAFAPEGTIPEETRFPALLPKNCRLSALLAEQVHSHTMHGGQHLCLAELRRSYWIISARTLVRKMIRNCVKCYRFNSRRTNPLMGDLPNERILPSPPFTYVGLDFAGPFATKGYKENEKSYVAVFVCFSTKAVHLEAVTSLRADHCAQAVHRLCARRGAPEAFFSDNGTNFIGARRELTEIQARLEHTFPQVAAEKGVQWCTIPQLRILVDFGKRQSNP
jgi:hypothetical protein